MGTYQYKSGHGVARATVLLALVSILAFSAVTWASRGSVNGNKIFNSSYNTTIPPEGSVTGPAAANVPHNNATSNNVTMTTTTIPVSNASSTAASSVAPTTTAPVTYVSTSGSNTMTYVIIVVVVIVVIALAWLVLGKKK